MTGRDRAVSDCLLFSEGVLLLADFSQVKIALSMMFYVVTATSLYSEHDLAGGNGYWRNQDRDNM